VEKVSVTSFLDETAKVGIVLKNAKNKLMILIICIFIICGEGNKT
jgi:hypothetical protein